MGNRRRRSVDQRTEFSRAAPLCFALGHFGCEAKDRREDGYPERLISLLDRDGACVARVTQTPDGFSILTVEGNTRETWPWNEDNDRIGRERLVSGELNALHVFNTARSFACCQEPRAEDRSDWDAQLGINRNIAITCKLEAGAVACR